MNIEAIVVKKVPIREHDQLVVLYSKELGKCAAIAKGSLRAHSKQALALDEGNIVRGELVSGRAGFVMTGAQAMRSFAGAKCSPKRWAAAQFFLQAVDALIYDHQPDDALWVCLQESLQRIDEATEENIVSLFRDQQRALLAVLGYGTCPEAALDGTFEQLAQRPLASLTLFSDVAIRRFS
jgi:DNA repair protein RecO (recombination protein O)